MISRYYSVKSAFNGCIYFSRPPEAAESFAHMDVQSSNRIPWTARSQIKPQCQKDGVIALLSDEKFMPVYHLGE